LPRRLLQVKPEAPPFAAAGGVKTSAQLAAEAEARCAALRLQVEGPLAYPPDLQVSGVGRVGWGGAQRWGPGRHALVASPAPTPGVCLASTPTT
jgi:hypothetical protein